MSEARRLGLVAVGGAIGALLRYAVSLWLPSECGVSGCIPWATVVVNILGALLIGVLAGVLVRASRDYLGPLLITGVLGGFTTVSAFAVDTVELLESGWIGPALVYVGITVTGGFIAVLVGTRLAGERS